MTTDIQVKDAMITDVVTGKPTTTVQEIAKIMKEKDIGSIIICEDCELGRITGIVTREDIVNKLVTEDICASDKPVNDIMSLNVISTEPETDLADAARMMAKYGFERLPVMSEGRLVGIISDREIAKIAPALVEILRERLMLDEGDDIGEVPIDELTSGDCEFCGNYKENLHSINGKWVCETCKEEAADI